MVGEVVRKHQARGEKVRFMLSMPVELKASLVKLAQAKNQSIAKTITDLLRKALRDIGFLEEGERNGGYDDS